MSAKLITSTVRSCGNITTVDDKIHLAETIKLSDNMPSVKEILFTKKNAVIQSVETENGVLSIKGEVRLDVFYGADTGRAESISSAIPFDYVRECSQNACAALLNTEIKKCELSSVNQRRTDVRIELELKGIVADEAVTENFEGVQDVSGIQTKTETHVAGTVKKLLSSYEYDYTFDVDNKDGIRIIYAGCALTERSTTSSRTGILFSAMAKAELIYAYENEEGEYEYKCMSDAFGINTMLDTNADMQFDSFSLNAQTVTEGADLLYLGDGPQIHIRSKVYFDVALFSETDIQTINDIYSTEHKLSPVKESMPLMRCKRIEQNDIALSGSASLSSDASINITGLSATQTEYEHSYENGSVFIKGEAEISALLFKNMSGEHTVSSLKIPFESEIKADIGENDAYLLYVAADAGECSVVGNKLNVRAHLNICCITVQNFSCEVIKEVAISEYEEDDDSSYCVKVIYNASDAELWELAKENRTTVENILSVNGIENMRELNENRPLIIK